MRYRQFCIVFVLLLILSNTSLGQERSCIETFEGIKPIEPEVNPTNRLTDYGIEMVWYSDSRCMLFGSTTGLWMYDIDLLNNPLMLAKLSDRAIYRIAVNPADSRIAFNAAQEPIVYLINVDGTTSTLRVENQAVTSIAFSPDGSLIAVASSNIGEDGFYWDARVQVWELASQKQIALLTSETSVIFGIFFAPDNRYMLTDGTMEGYGTNDVEYWDLGSSSRIWTYDDLFRGLERWSENDPHVVTKAIMKGETVALAGLDGWLDYDDYYGTGIHIWNAPQQKRKLEIVVTRRTHSDDEHYLADIAFNSDGSVLALSTDNGVTQLWSMTSLKQIAEFSVESPEVRQISFSPDDKFLAFIGEDVVTIWDIEQMEEYTSFALPNDNSSSNE